MEFYKIWQTKSGLIGLNKLTLGNLVMIEVATLLLGLIVVALLVAVFPIIFFVIYILLMIGLDGDERGGTTRLGVNIVTIITTIYFLLDFHFGWFSHQILGGSMYSDTYNALAIRNLSIALMSIALFFVGHEVYRGSSNRFMRVIFLLAFIFFGFKFTDKVSKSIITNTITQYNDSELTQRRIELKTWTDKNYSTDEERLQKKIDALEKEKADEQRMKDFDKNFLRDYY